MVVAMRWVSQITTISFEMIIPAGIGYWLDQRWGTKPWLLIVGAILGMAVGMKHLLDVAQAENKSKPKD